MPRPPAKPSVCPPDRRTRRLLKAMAWATLYAGAAGPAGAQTFLWDADTPKFWDDNDGLDWIDLKTQEPTPAPFGGQGAYALINNGGTAIIRQDIADIQDIIVGDAASLGSTLVHTAGSTSPQQGTPGSVIVGRNGTTGTYLMTDKALQAKPVMLIGWADNNKTLGGHGTLKMFNDARFVGQQLGIGISGNIEALSTGTASMTNNTTLRVGDWLRLSNGGMDLAGQAYAQVDGDLWVGDGQGANAVLTLGEKSQMLVNGNIRLGRNSSTATINLTGGALLQRSGGSGYIGLGRLGSGGGATVNLYDKAQLLSSTNLVLAESGSRSSSFNQFGGYVELWDNPNQPNFPDALEIDPGGDNLGLYHLAGGTLKVQTVDASTGTFKFTGGKLMISKRFRGDLVQDGGILAPGSSPGEVTIEGDYFLNSDEEAGVLEIELGGTTPVADFDKVNVIGDVHLNSGTLRVLLYAGFMPERGNRFDFMDWTGTLTGNYDKLELPKLAENRTWDTSALITEGMLSVVLPGDTDGDGDVDDSDLGTAFANYTGPVGAAGGKSALQGDTDYDGDVDDSDLGGAFANYTGPLAPASTVPEPATLGLLIPGLLLATTRRRRG